MGFVQSLVGSNTGAGYQAVGTSAGDRANAQEQVNGSQSQQNALLNALSQQGGIQNQNAAFQGLQGVANQYQNVANGTGPNPALAMLNQQTGANVANQASLMAGQRGASSNAGLIARQAAQQGGALQQQAVGQGASMAAQQQLAGLQGLGQAQANVANLATQQVGQQTAAAQAQAQTALSNQQNLLGIQSNINTTNAGIAAGNQKAQAGLIGGVLGSVGAGSNSLSSSQGSARGGYIEGYADGGQAGVVVAPDAANSASRDSGSSALSRYLRSTSASFQGGQGQSALNQDSGRSGDVGGQGLYKLGKSVYNGGKSLYNYLTTPSPTPWAGADASNAGSVNSLTGSSGTQLASADTAGAGAAGTDAAAGVGADAAGAEGAEDILAAVSTGGQIEAGYNPKETDPSTVGGTLGTVMGYLESKGGRVDDGKQKLVKVLLSPGEKVAEPKEVQKVAKGGEPKLKTVPGKAEVKGDSPKNDKVYTKVPAGTVIVKRTRANNDPEGFIRAVLAKRGTGK